MSSLFQFCIFNIEWVYHLWKKACFQKLILFNIYLDIVYFENLFCEIISENQNYI